MAKELSTILKDRIKNYKVEATLSAEGKIISVADGIATVSGLYETMAGEILEFPNKVLGMVLDLEEDTIGVALFGDYSQLTEGNKVIRTKVVVETGVGDVLLGRVVDVFGNPVDGKGAIKFKNFRHVEKVAPGIMTRQSVNTPMETGILAIDSIVPIGRGQRELIIGDRKTGKTTIAVDTILNQIGKDVKVVYVSIGQKAHTLSQIAAKLEAKGALEFTTIVAATAADSDAEQYIAPFSGMSMAEEWMAQGQDVLIILDDLSKHAVAYRSISLLLRRPPGREAYPGDVFYLHSRLLERSGKMNKENGGGSITALPIIETQDGDISAYIPTNVISITDGQIFLMTDKFNSGQRPAVDAGLSVSRVGSSAQTKVLKEAASGLMNAIASYEEIKGFSEFSSDVDQNTKNLLDNGSKIEELLKQPINSPLDQGTQTIILFGIKQKLFANADVKKMALIKDYITNDKTFDDLKKKLNSAKELDDKLKSEITDKLITLVNTTNRKK